MLSTSHKIRIARALSSVILFFRSLAGLPVNVVVKRRGLTWSLNLKEGIDLAIYLLGGFEVTTLRRYKTLIKRGDVVLDIGANVGAHTLPLAQFVGSSGKVITFEPTSYAFAKQKTNISLNPDLASRIYVNQIMLVAKDADPLPDAVYSSWPLDAANDLHGMHHGRLMDTQGAMKGTLDAYLKMVGIEKINFIKLDVDGNELDVLSGASATLMASKPHIILELAPYIYNEDPSKFDALLNYLWSMGYQFSYISSGRLLPRNLDEVRRLIPKGGCLNVLARFQG